MSGRLHIKLTIAGQQVLTEATGRVKFKSIEEFDREFDRLKADTRAIVERAMKKDAG